MYLSIPLVKAKTSYADIEALALKYEPKIAKAVQAALDKKGDSLNLDALAAALEAGQVEVVLQMVQQSGSAAMQNAVTTINGVAIEEAHGVADEISPGGLPPVLPGGGGLGGAERFTLRGAEFAFDRLNPVLTDWLRRYNLNLIKQIDDGTRAGVRAILDAGMRAGKNPRVMARDIKDIVGLTDRQTGAVANFRRELETFHARRSASAYNLGAKIDRANGFQVLRQGEDGAPMDGIQERRLRDFRYDKQLANAMASGKPLKPDVIDKMVNAYARKYRKYRAETIARTETVRALNVGVQEGWRQAIASGKIDETLVRRYWKVGKDERTCKVCNGIAEENADGVGFGQPFESSAGPIFLPPQHPSCRCHVFIRLHEPEELK